MSDLPTLRCTRLCLNASCRRKRDCHCRCDDWFGGGYHNYNDGLGDLYGDCLRHCDKPPRANTREEFIDRYSDGYLYSEYGYVSEGYVTPEELIIEAMNQEEQKANALLKEKKDSTIKTIFFLAASLGVLIGGYLLLKD